MAQAYGENLKQAMDTLRTHKLRSALTVFGVVLGVSVIMLVAALMTGFDQKVQENVKQFGADTAFITKWDQGRHGGPPPLEERQRKPLTIEDAKAIQERCPAVKNVTTFSDDELGSCPHRAYESWASVGHRFPRRAAELRRGLRQRGDP